jgi:hypothetical protein
MGIYNEGVLESDYEKSNFSMVDKLEHDIFRKAFGLWLINTNIYCNNNVCIFSNSPRFHVCIYASISTSPAPFFCMVLKFARTVASLLTRQVSESPILNPTVVVLESTLNLSSGVNPARIPPPTHSFILFETGSSHHIGTDTPCITPRTRERTFLQKVIYIAAARLPKSASGVEASCNGCSSEVSCAPVTFHH